LFKPHAIGLNIFKSLKKSGQEGGNKGRDKKSGLFSCMFDPLLPDLPELICNIEKGYFF
jgi:hypothetical protein